MNDVVAADLFHHFKLYLTLAAVVLILFGFRINQLGGIGNLEQLSANTSVSRATMVCGVSGEGFSQLRSLKSCQAIKGQF